MTAYLVRIELRRRRWSLLLLGILVAAVVGVALASVAGARRAETAFDRYLDQVKSPDAMASGEPAARAALGGLDAVEEATEIELVAAFPEADEESFYPLIVSEGGVLPFERMRSPVVDGRFPERDAPFEVALSERTSRRLGVGVGDELPLTSFTQEGLAAFDAGEDVAPDGPPVSLDVVGVVRDPGDIGSRESDITLTFLTPAFREELTADEVGKLSDGTMVSVADGYSLSDVSAALAGEDVELDASFSTAAVRQQITPTMQAIATSTRLFALVAALAGLITIGQAIARLQLGASVDDRALESLGASRGARWQRLFLPIALAIGSGAVLGVVVAVGLSTLFPVGLARKAEPDLGLDVDGAALALGFALSLLAFIGLAALLTTWRVRKRYTTEESIRVSRWSRTLADLGAPPSAVTGLALAAGTPGHPGRIAVGGTLLSVLGVLATLVFSASVDRLAADPALFGWGWDADIEGADLTDLDQDAAVLGPRLDADPDVQAAATLYSQLPVTIDDVPLFGTAVAEVDAALRPVIVQGTGPASADEVALGRDSLDEVGAEVGDEVTLSLGDGERTVRITGVVALPVPEDGGSSSTGVYLSPLAVDELDIDEMCVDSDSCSRTIAVALREGTDVDAFAIRHQDSELDTHVALPMPPAEVDRLTAVENLPRYLAIFLAGLAAAAISFATATTIRQRRRDLAMLRVLGMTGRHVRAVVIVLVLALTSAGALLGGALGLVVGRQVWRAVTDSVSLPFAPSIPVLAAVLVPIGAVLLAQVVASTSRRAAGRIPAALVLRAE